MSDNSHPNECETVAHVALVLTVLVPFSFVSHVFALE